jgi:hypothetical protein
MNGLMEKKNKQITQEIKLKAQESVIWLYQVLEPKEECHVQFDPHNIWGGAKQMFYPHHDR